MKQIKTHDKESIVVLTEDFSDNRLGWELTQNQTESASITESGYHLKNSSMSHWHHFSIFPGIASLQNTRIQCRIEIDPNSGPGQMGLIWGFDKKMSRLNRFCLSTEGRGCSVLHFQKNHQPVFHRFYEPFVAINRAKPVVLGIAEKYGYWSFYINKKLVYIGHQIHFSHLGNGIGFYLDPGVSITVQKIRITQKKTNKAFSLN